MKKRKVGRPRKPGRPKKIKMKRKAAKRRGRPPGSKNKKQKVIRIVEPVVNAGSQINWEKQVLSILKTAVKPAERAPKEKAGLKEVVYTRTNITSKNGSEKMEFHIACAPGTDGKAELMILQGLRAGTAPIEPKVEVSPSAKARMKEDQKETEMHNGFGN